MKWILILVLFAVVNNQYCFSQKNEIDVRNQKVTEYPKVEGLLWVRNPNGIDTATVKFYENDANVNVQFQSQQKSDSVPVYKNVLFLVLNSPNQSEMDWYKSVIKNALAKGTILKGDKIDIMTFSCKEDGQLLFPNTFRFTDNLDTLFSRIDNIKSKRRDRACFNKSHIYLAIHEALDLLGKENNELPKGIFVLADEKAFNTQLTAESTGDRSRRLNIPIYGISFYKNKTNYSIQDLCDQTYGDYFIDSKNDVNVSSNILIDFLTNFNSNHAGVYYPFEYSTSFEKDGKMHPVKIDSKSGQSGFALLIPSKSFLELASDNWILTLILIVLFITLIIVLVMLRKKNILKKQELEIQRNSQMEEMGRQQMEAQGKLSDQEQRLKQIKEEENQRFNLEQENKSRALQKIEDDKQLSKMLERGNLPWFEFKLGNESGNFQIQTPRFTVGRDASCDWTINHPAVSRKHFNLIFKDYQYTISDLGSSNGIVVNGQKVSECKLNHGDHILVGDVSLTFHI